MRAFAYELPFQDTVIPSFVFPLYCSIAPLIWHPLSAVICEDPWLAGAGGCHVAVGRVGDCRVPPPITALLQLAQKQAKMQALQKQQAGGPAAAS